MSTPAHTAPPGIDWLVDCPRLPGRALDQEVVARTQCGIVTVPQDHQAPNARTLRLTITRVGARQPLERRGVIFARPATAQADLRGVFAVHLATVWKYYNNEAYRTLIRFYDVIELSPRNGTDHDQSAWDMEFVRQQLGEQRISFLGIAQGNLLGAGYAQLFAERVERMVLIQPDSATVQASEPLPATLRLKGPYLQSTTTDASQCVNRWAGTYLAHGRQPPPSTDCLDD
ncbi:alpha/beta fold hydrolase [Pseudomonas fluorescens]|uniref:alpha/beta fold hydrolase n=1 Tax=Pseudomonas fluorescens TaxID=294 RepID=UPI0002D73A0F|nr:alpha/beta fold hydrolase [Pseudomonas fluorescens]